MEGTKDPMWEDVNTAAKRLKRSRGQVARVCLDRLQKEGLARFVKDDGRGHWEIRSDATLKRRRSGGNLRSAKRSASTPIRIESQNGTTKVIVGDVAIAATGDFTITIQPGAEPAVTTPGTGPA